MYTVRDLLNDLEGFDLDAEITIDEDRDENEFFTIHNPTEIDGHKEWLITITEIEEDDFDDCDYEVGFDPYMGCFSDDC